MKKIKLNTQKLKLTKEKIASLTNNEMKTIYGGDASYPNVCNQTEADFCITSVQICGTTGPGSTPPPTDPPESGVGPVPCTAFPYC